LSIQVNTKYLNSNLPLKKLTTTLKKVIFLGEIYPNLKLKNFPKNHQFITLKKIYLKGFLTLSNHFLNGDSLPDDVIDEVFWHEILHIVLDKSGYRPGTDLKHDHTFIESATPTLHQIMDQVMEWNERELEPVDEVEEADPMADYFRSKEIHLECGGEWEYLPNMVKKCRRCGHEERWVYS
jgi:hypothetical protein